MLPSIAAICAGLQGNTPIPSGKISSHTKAGVVFATYSLLHSGARKTWSQAAMIEQRNEMMVARGNVANPDELEKIQTAIDAKCAAPAPASCLRALGGSAAAAGLHKHAAEGPS